MNTVPMVILGGFAYARLIDGTLVAAPFENGQLEMDRGEPNWCDVASFDAEPEVQAEINTARAMLAIAGSAA
jgi:hypothetical protein